jgi:hypothetical protein
VRHCYIVCSFARQSEIKSAAASCPLVQQERKEGNKAVRIELRSLQYLDVLEALALMFSGQSMSAEKGSSLIGWSLSAVLAYDKVPVARRKRFLFFTHSGHILL